MFLVVTNLRTVHHSFITSNVQTVLIHFFLPFFFRLHYVQVLFIFFTLSRR